MLGQRRRADGGSHNAEPAQPALHAIPGHRITAEDAGQGPERDAKLAQKQWSFDVRRAHCHVGHQKGRADAVSRVVFQEDAPDWDLLLSRHAVVLQFVSEREVHREQLRGLTETIIKGAPKHLGIMDDPQIEIIYPIPIRVPKPAEQKAIAVVLGTLDDKIELNRKMNEALESMARALFKSWFIDFDPVRAKADGCNPEGMDEATARLFPDSFDASELGEIPQGWIVRKLASLTTKIGSGATPRGGSKVYLSQGVAFIRSQNVYDDEFHWDGLARITDDAANDLRNVTVQHNDILINITGDSILRTCVVTPEVLPARVNQHVAIIRACEPVPPRFIHQFLVRPETKDILLGFDSGGSRKAVTKGHLESLPILTPPQPVLGQFAALTEPFFDRVTKNSREIRILAEIRDSLLPKLLSGELRIKHAERFVEASL